VACIFMKLELKTSYKSINSSVGTASTTKSIYRERRDQLTMGYFDNFDNGSLKKYKKILKIEKNL
jgi:hypothetical protein